MRDQNFRGQRNQDSKSADLTRTARLLAALHQAASEHRIDPDEVPALWDWIVDDTTRSSSEQRDCMWDWVVCEDTLSRPRRRAPVGKAKKGGLN